MKKWVQRDVTVCFCTLVVVLELTYDGGEVAVRLKMNAVDACRVRIQLSPASALLTNSLASPSHDQDFSHSDA
jgi:hypothetical protein